MTTKLELYEAYLNEPELNELTPIYNAFSAGYDVGVNNAKLQSWKKPLEEIKELRAENERLKYYEMFYQNLNVVGTKSAQKLLDMLTTKNIEIETLKKENEELDKKYSEAVSIISKSVYPDVEISKLHKLIRDARNICKTCIPNKTGTINYAKEWLIEAEKVLGVTK